MDITEISENTRKDLQQLVAEDNDLISIFHMGDIAYDIEDDNGTRGDDYFRNMESVIANIPYMVDFFV